MRDENEIPYIVIERERGGAVPFLWGALIGAGAALLFAPRTGREVQRELRAGLHRVRDQVRDRIDDARESVATAVDQAREEVHERIRTARSGVEDRAGNVRDAADVARREADRARSDLHSRVATAKQAYDIGQAAATGKSGARVEAEITVGETETERELPEERAD